MPDNANGHLLLQLLMKQGFTLVEVILVLGIFGILMIAGTDFLIQVVRNGNQATTQNEVRQNASKIMQDLEASIRSAACVNWVVGNTFGVGPKQQDITLRTYSDNCHTALVNEYKFFFDPQLRSNQGVVLKNGQPLVSTASAVLDCVNASQCGTSCDNGVTISGTPLTNQAVTITLTVQSTTSATRSDFCAATKLSETITPRSQY